MPRVPGRAVGRRFRWLLLQRSSTVPPRMPRSTTSCRDAVTLITPDQYVPQGKWQSRNGSGSFGGWEDRLVHDDERCPCLSGDTYGACCGRYHSGAASAPTAEALMRSRYSAFAVGDEAYLLATWAPQTRPDSAGLGDEQWRRLDIHRTERGGPFDTTGVVEFT